MSDMYQVMDMWGAWAAAENSGVDWSPIAAGFKGLIPHGKRSRIQCSDDDGIVIDGCVGRLKKCKPDEYELVVAHFIFGVSLRALARRNKCSDGTIRKKMQVALGFIEAVQLLVSEGGGKAKNALIVEYEFSRTSVRALEI